MERNAAQKIARPPGGAAACVDSARSRVASVAALIAVAIGIVLSYTIHWFPVQASTQAKNTDRSTTCW